METLNPRKKHTVTLSSRFVCSQDMCYALTTEGFLVTLDYTQKQVETKQIVQKQDIILDKIYQPLIVEGNIVFSAGNGEFAIYNIERKAVIGQSTFVDQESTSMFDVHLVKNIYSSGSNVIISHLNGMYAFNILQGQTLWEKNLTVEDILISENYMIFLDEKSQKITCMHIQSGEVKWAEPIKMKKKERAEVVLMNIMKDEKGEYSLAIGEKRGFHILSLEDGSQTSFKKANLENIAYSFVHNNKLYYIKSSNIYQVK